MAYRLGYGDNTQLQHGCQLLRHWQHIKRHRQWGSLAWQRVSIALRRLSTRLRSQAQQAHLAVTPRCGAIEIPGVCGVFCGS
jgi:hypothetical protein